MIDAEPRRVALNIQTVQTDNVPAYVEIYVDDVLRGGRGSRRRNATSSFRSGIRGTHRVEVVLANPMTRNG